MHSGGTYNATRQGCEFSCITLYCVLMAQNDGRHTLPALQLAAIVYLLKGFLVWQLIVTRSVSEELVSSRGVQIFEISNMNRILHIFDSCSRNVYSRIPEYWKISEHQPAIEYRVDFHNSARGNIKI